MMLSTDKDVSSRYRRYAGSALEGWYRGYPEAGYSEAGYRVRSK